MSKWFSRICSGAVIIIIAVVIIICLLSKEHSNAKLISGAITAAAGITMIGMLIIMCVNAV